MNSDYYFYNNTQDKKSNHKFKSGNVFMKFFDTKTCKNKIKVFEEVIENNNWDKNDIIIASANINMEEFVYQYGKLIIQEQEKIFKTINDDISTKVFYEKLYSNN